MGASFTAGQRITAAALNHLPVTLPLTTGNVSNSVAETTIGTFTIPGNDPVVGGGYLFRCFGIVSDTLTPTFFTRVKLTGPGGSLLAGSFGGTLRSSVANMRFDITLEMFFTAIGSTGSFDTVSTQRDTLTSASINFTGSAVPGLAVDTTNAIIIAVTAQFGTANAANTASTTSGVMNRL